MQSTGSRGHGLSSCGSWALENRLNSCGTQAWLFYGMWDLPRPGIELVFPALAGRFFTTEPSGSPRIYFLTTFIDTVKHSKTKVMATSSVLLTFQGIGPFGLHCYNQDPDF